MNSRTTSRLAWSVCGFDVALFLSVIVVGRIDTTSRAAGLARGQGQAADVAAFAAFVLAFSIVGALMASRRPENPIGWLLLGSGSCYALAGGGLLLALYPATATLSHWLGWLWGLGAGIGLTFVLLLFPTGALPSRRWRPVAWVAGAALAAFVLGSWFAPGPISGSVQNPLGVSGALGHLFQVLQGAYSIVALAGLASVASLVVRFRRADWRERQQLKWLLLAGVLVALALLAKIAIDKIMGPTERATNIENALGTAALAFVPVAIGVAILRHGLYEIDVVINRTVVYGALAAFITGVYVAIVVGIGSLIGHAGRPNVALSILATAIVAVAFQPVRERVQRFANRLVYGKRATPYEALSEFSDQMGVTIAAEDLLPHVARVLADATGAARTQVWLRSGQELVLEATFPDDRAIGETVPFQGDTLPALPNATRAFEVSDRGEPLGALTLTKRPGEALTPTEEKLASHMASQAGLVLRNVGLTEQLKARMAELRESRLRIVAAADAERRRLERDIHDGAQQQLVALSVKVRLAETMVDRDRDGARTLVTQVQADAKDALENLRDLARGIYPPLLADRGLAAALDAQARKATVPVAVEASGVGRYPQDAEAAVYFCALEALQNVAKYASASRVTVRLSHEDDHLEFSVADDGIGFEAGSKGYGTGLQGMADRLAALGGELEVRSTPGRGTSVTGRLPARALEPAG